MQKKKYMGFIIPLTYEVCQECYIVFVFSVNRFVCVNFFFFFFFLIKDLLGTSAPRVLKFGANFIVWENELDSHCFSAYPSLYSSNQILCHKVFTVYYI